MTKRKRTTSVEASLFEAVIKGDLDYIAEFIDDSSCQIHTEDDQTLLHFAVEYGHANIVLFLLTFGADVSRVDKNGMTPLHFASLYGSLDIATILINNDSDINLLDLDGASPLHMASQNNHLNIVKLLIDNGANIYNEDIEGVTPLHIAIYNNNVDMVKFFLSQMDKDFIKKKITLHNIVEKSCNEMIDLFLTLGLDINAKDINGMTPLDISVNYGLVNTARFLIEHNAQFEDRKYSMLARSVINNDQKMVELLIEKGATLNENSNSQITLLHIAINNINPDIVTLLINNGADVDKFYKNKNSALHLAVKQGSVEITELLLLNGAQVDLLNNNESTPLHIAAAKGYIEIIRVLLEHNAKIECPNRCGTTPLGISFIREHYDCVEFFIKNGASIYDSQGNNKICVNSSIDIYNKMYNQYIAYTMFYNPKLIKNPAHQDFINSSSFSGKDFENISLETKNITRDAANLLSYITSDLLEIDTPLLMDDLVYEIAKFLNITEITKVIRNYNYDLNKTILNLEDHGYIVQDVGNDVDSFFKALAIAIDVPENDLRRTIDYNKNNDPNFMRISNLLDNYIEYKSKSGICIDNIVKLSLANILCKDIAIHHLYSLDLDINSECINLLYTGDRYMPITVLNTEIQSLLFTEYSLIGSIDIEHSDLHI